MRAKAFLAAIAAFAASTSFVMAASEDVFVVARVPVQAQADSATAAKETAQADGRRRAMDILLRRLTPEADWGYLPTLATGAPAERTGDGAGKTALAVSPSDLVALESGFEVYDEKSSSKTYRAYITYRFKPDAVRRLLKTARIPYSEAQTRTALVIPVLETDSGLYLWESNNPWLAAWKERPLDHELTPMTAPLGDLEDSTALSARAALALDAEALAKIAANYSVSQVLLAHARLNQEEGEDRLRVRLINAHRETGKAAAAAEALGEEVASADHAPSQETFAFTAPDEDFAAEVGETVAEVYLTQPSGDFPALAEQSIDAVIEKYAAGWKQRTLIDHAQETLLPVTAFFGGVEDWTRIREALVATPMVGSVQVNSLSRRGAEMDVLVFGDPTRVQVAMENRGIVFWTERGDRWFLASPELARRYRGQRFLRAGGDRFEAEEAPIEPLPASVEQPQ